MWSVVVFPLVLSRSGMSRNSRSSGLAKGSSSSQAFAVRLDLDPTPLPSAGGAW